jgi:hypothetical protein
VDFLTDDTTSRLGLLTRRVREAAVQAAVQVERSRDACAAARYVLSDLQRVREKVGE